MQFNISQEPLYTEIYRKNAAPQIEPRTRTHTSREPAQSKRMSRFHKSHFMRKFTPQNEPRTRTRILCELAQSKRMSTFHKSHSLQKFTAKMLRPRISPERRRTLCASLRSRSTCQDFTRATLYRNLQEKCRTPSWAQNADEHFVRACAVETHVKISQEPLYTEIYRRNAAPQSEHPDQAPPLTPTVRTLSVDTLFGEKSHSYIGFPSLPCLKPTGTSSEVFIFHIASGSNLAMETKDSPCGTRAS